MKAAKLELLVSVTLWIVCLGLCSLIPEATADKDVESGWKTGSLLKYDFNMLAAITNENYEPYFKANLHIQPLSRDKLSITALNSRERDLFVEEDLHRNNTLPWSEPYMTSSHFSGEPFEINFKKGLITSLTVSENITDIELVMIRVVGSLLQLDLQGVLPTAEAQKSVYTTMENSTHGVCETRYEVPPLSPSGPQTENGQLFEVVKFIDYKICTKSASERNSTSESDGEKPHQDISSTSTFNYKVSGSVSEHIIQSSVSTAKKVYKSQIPLHPSRTERLLMNLTLTSTEPANGQPPKISYPRSVQLAHNSENSEA